MHSYEEMQLKKEKMSTRTVTPTIPITTIPKATTSNVNLFANKHNNVQEANLFYYRQERAYLTNAINKSFRHRFVWQSALVFMLLLPLPTIAANSFKAYAAHNDKFHIKSIAMQDRFKQRNADNDDANLRPPTQVRAARDRYVTKNVFDQTQRIPIFKPISTDIRPLMFLTPKSLNYNKIVANPHQSVIGAAAIANTKAYLNCTGDKSSQVEKLSNKVNVENNGEQQLSLEKLLIDYITKFFEEGTYEPLPGLLVELKKNSTSSVNTTDHSRIPREAKVTSGKIMLKAMPRTLQTGRLLFLTGLKKILWPIFMGLQIFKSLLIAMFIPAIIGSFGKLIGKGITSGSAPLFIRPMEPPQELDFRDNTLNFEDDNKFIVTMDDTKDNPAAFAYNQAEASQVNNQYAYNSNSPGTRLTLNERQHQLMQDSYLNALQSLGSASFKNSGSLSGSLSGGSSSLLAPMRSKPAAPANINRFHSFKKVPDSSLLLSNYDPFYSPLLSRLDSVFAQLKLNSSNEVCREKVICLMYASPAKYAPYSNLVSAQLSRELNELRKPTSDNPDILRFFKYMRAAKDGQDGTDCEEIFDRCTEFKDFENPAMVNTYHDIDKLVQARKLIA
uniref:Uncharacterized protein n=1 Tax=Glossina palpalis gambiensis TaxID=67801 RepID=A0A1B0B4V8_9MUSC